MISILGTIQASDLTKKEEYGHLEQPAATTMNQWGSAACIIQRAVRRQCCVVVSNTAAVPPHALVEYREDVSYYMLKSGGADPAAQHKSTNNASTEAVVVRMGPSSSFSCSTHSPSHAHMYDLARSCMLRSLAISFMRV